LDLPKALLQPLVVAQSWADNKLENLLPITLSAERGNWQRFMNRKANKAFAAVKAAILKRDDDTCRYCGFQVKQDQEILNIDQNYDNNPLDNLATACRFCAQCFFLDSVGLDGKSGGTLIYLPEISQADLNHFARTLFSSMLRDTPYKGKLQAAYLSLTDRATLVEEVFGPHTKDPIVFGQTMIETGLTAVQLKHPIFSELKLLPTRKYYKADAEYWKSTVFQHIPL
jgi:intracellular multiplication protein IcmJ